MAQNIRQKDSDLINTVKGTGQWASVGLIASLFLFGCAPSNELGKQHYEQEFTAPLTETDVIQSTVTRDYTRFGDQAELVLTNSPSLNQRYQELYTALSDWAIADGDPKNLAQYDIEVAQLSGGDRKGNVLFTGYFSPVIEMRHQPDETYRFPVYSNPGCGEQCPTRAQINDGALEGQGLEIGYAASQIAPFLMEVQGSGFVHFGDDNSMQYFAYSGKNNKPYVSIGRVLIESGEVPREQMSVTAIKDWVASQPEEKVTELLEQNPSYVFFQPNDNLDVKGSAGIPLLPLASVAGDRSLFPMGTPILAEVPLLNADGSWSGVHQLRLLIVLDTGGAVKGSHLDLYHGMGAHLGKQSGYYKHFGRVWKLGLSGTETAQPWQLTD
ncbi:murein transglycosylase A [Vibrio ulleungensis]|uniref:peptidoglycan lytic exotransglycosylase n=1 Tax=Vibrio ulleungensis TaxID=2807619 RepID=A0ABS2HFX6_9VIBR|nr:murein transglycosylase A [Vibrio ulleungensis]MBM7036455.1 murein transglycosylase A [Vibrio ulleungensis]